MTLKDTLFQQFNIDLPISGAEGESIDAPIILHREGINDFVGLELTLIKYLMLKQGVEWKKHGQSIVKYKDRLIDEVKIEVRKESGDRVVSFIDKFYFDITACIDLERKDDNYFDETLVLHRIINRLKELEKINEFNAKCIQHIRKDCSARNITEIVKFLDVLKADQIYSDLESMYLKKGKPILEVLSMIGKQL
jgi:hypothetical protein